MQITSFENQFLSQSMRQSFNKEVMNFISDNDESALHKWLRASGLE